MTNQSIPDLIVKNANVITIDETLPRAEAFAISNGKFVAIGSNADIQNIASSNTKIYLEVRGKKIPANVCDLPFYKKNYVKGEINVRS